MILLIILCVYFEPPPVIGCWLNTEKVLSENTEIFIIIFDGCLDYDIM